MRLYSKTAQNILEYTLLLAAVISIIVVVLLGSNGIKDKVGLAYNRTGDALATTTLSLTSGVYGGH